MSGRIAKQ
jgi:hypothetical protein